MGSIVSKTAQELLENAQVIFESLEGALFRLYVSYDQCDLSDDKTKAMMSVCGMLANGALEDIESASAKTKSNISLFVSQATGILVMLDELSDLNLSKGYTAAAIHGLLLAAEQLKESLEVAAEAVVC
ncbi:hypothetical protein NI465_15870 [Acinetobacter lwoffii]|uniref:hypothetical protein n=1 Tax=Acinetobacter lwoffii TaxID=28090 RepID=UPI00209AC999|nr:hypothetical protein [Acinetobacter lwoffii]MCO8115630.1 hypothetical protein [Acinetobacter lwoffii]